MNFSFNFAESSVQHARRDPTFIESYPFIFMKSAIVLRKEEKKKIGNVSVTIRTRRERGAEVKIERSVNSCALVTHKRSHAT